MQQRPLGNSGITVSALGLGTVKLGRNTSLRYPSAFTIPNRSEAAQLLDTAADLGINLLDTAPAYGSSEQLLGDILQGQREKWVLTTKVGESFDGSVSRFDFSAAAITASITRSLANLRTEVLDIVLIHSSGDDLAILEHSAALDCLQSLKAQGLIRAVGISHKTIAGGLRAIELGCDVIMATLNLAEQQQLAVIAAAQQAGCGVLVKKALASGHAGSASLAFASTCEGVSSVVVGTINPQHLRANAEVVERS